MTVEAQSLQERFNVLAERWRKETGGMSSIGQMVRNPAYQEIIRMGQDAVSLILVEMEQHHGHWFMALAAITGEQAILAEHAGYVKAMREDWLAWGRKNGYLAVGTG